MILLVWVYVPNHRCRGSRDDAVGGTDRICVSICTDGRNGKMCWSGKNHWKVPCKCDKLTRCDLVERSGSLGWLCYGDDAHGGSLWNDKPGSASRIAVSSTSSGSLLWLRGHFEGEESVKRIDWQREWPLGTKGTAARVRQPRWKNDLFVLEGVEPQDLDWWERDLKSEDGNQQR